MWGVPQKYEPYPLVSSRTPGPRAGLGSSISDMGISRLISEIWESILKVNLTGMHRSKQPPTLMPISASTGNCARRLFRRALGWLWSNVPQRTRQKRPALFERSVWFQSKHGFLNPMPGQGSHGNRRGKGNDEIERQRHCWPEFRNGLLDRECINVDAVRVVVCCQAAKQTSICQAKSQHQKGQQDPNCHDEPVGPACQTEPNNDRTHDTGG